MSETDAGPGNGAWRSAAMQRGRARAASAGERRQSEETMRVEVGRALTGTAALLLQDATQAPVASQLIL